LVTSIGITIWTGVSARERAAACSFGIPEESDDGAESDVKQE